MRGQEFDWMILGHLFQLRVFCDCVKPSGMCPRRVGQSLIPHEPRAVTQDALRSSGSDGMGQISLEFYQKKKSRWPFSDECIPWELWTIKVNVVNLANEQERQICREKVGEKLCEKIINIVEVMNRHEYLPKMPTQSEVDNVFDTSLKDVQPYLYKISYQITDSLGTSVTTTMRRLIKDTLAL